MAAGNKSDVQEGRFDDNEKAGFQQAAAGGRDALFKDFAKGPADQITAQQGDTQAFGVGKDGNFKFASSEQIASMDTKTLTAYVQQHDDFTKAQVASHPEKLDRITASYATRLTDDMTQQSRANVQQFYGALGKAVQA